MINRTTYKNDTKEHILHAALRLFNEHGVEFIGIREIARTLGLSPGNMSYYFPKKEDLILALSLELSTKNSALFMIPDDLTFSAYLNRFDQIARNQYEYRFLLISTAHLLVNYPGLAKKYHSTQVKRRDDITRIIDVLRQNGYIKKNLGAKEQDTLRSCLKILGRFWMADWYGESRKQSLEERLAENRELYIFLFKEYLTSKGLRDIPSNA